MNALQIGPEFRINTHTENDQDNANVSALEDGGFVATWRVKTPDGTSRSMSRRCSPRPTSSPTTPTRTAIR